jgi:RNA polymerase sigma-70 factor (ECF subfamily)
MRRRVQGARPLRAGGNQMSQDAIPFAFSDSGQEADLIARAQMGDQPAFLTLARHYQRPLYRLLYAMSLSEEGAAKMTEEALVRAWQEMPEYPTGRRFLPWVIRIARALPPPTSAKPDWNRADALLTGVNALRVDDRMTLALRVVERLRYEQIAALLGIPVGTVILRLAQARSQILAATAGVEAPVS